MAVGGTAFKKFLSQVLCSGDNKKEGVDGGTILKMLSNKL